MSHCPRLDAGAVELYFYDELDRLEREQMTQHLRSCRVCVQALEELQMIREALAARPDVSAPPGGDWSGFMTRLGSAVLTPKADVVPFVPRPTVAVRRYVGLLATAALLALVTLSVYFVARQQPAGIDDTPMATASNDATPVATTGLRAVGEKHFERSKLVVLGLATRESAETSAADWAYERELAGSLLKDTRLYRQAAEEHGLTALAGIMRDLELVLLETSMADGVDTGELGQIQRLIQKRNLVQKMDTVAMVGM